MKLDELAIVVMIYGLLGFAILAAAAGVLSLLGFNWQDPAAILQALRDAWCCGEG